MNTIEQFKAFLKSQGVEDAKVETIANGLAGAKIYLSAEEKIDERYQKLKGKNELLEDQLKAANGTIETLKKSNGSNEDLQGEVQKYKDANKDLQEKYDRDVTRVEKKQQVIEALKKENALYPELLAANIDLEKIELKDGKISGHKDAIKTLKETYKDQFKVVEDPAGGDDGAGGDPYTYTPPGGKGDNNGPVDIYSAMAEFSVHK